MFRHRIIFLKLKNKFNNFYFTNFPHIALIDGRENQCIFQTDKANERSDHLMLPWVAIS